MFKENSKAIYLQIADRITDDILSGVLQAGQRLPSVREYAMTVQVNPNTMMRTYEHLAQAGVIYNRRGIGFFVSDNALDIVHCQRSASLLDDELNGIFRQLDLLGITPQQLFDRYKAFTENSKKD